MPAAHPPAAPSRARPPAGRGRLTPASRRRWSALQHAANWGRVLATAVVLLAQLGALAYGLIYLSDLSPWFLTGNGVVVAVAVLFILNSRMPSAYKLAWVIPILVMPIFGGAFYLLFGARKIAPWSERRWRATAERAAAAMALVPTATAPADGVAGRQVRALEATSPYRLRADTAAHYVGFGDLGIDAMIAAIDAAERYVYCEYFIIGDGVMWRRLRGALLRAAGRGVDVRVLYDDIGSLFTLPAGFRRDLEAGGVRLHRVNPLGMLFTLRFNYRDHRKLLAIDGRVAFTGGINIADEYINAKARFGRWKDTVLRLEGPGAWSLTVAFLEMWELVSGDQADYEALVPPAAPPRPDAGLCLPYTDTPYDDIPLGELTYRHMIMTAARSVDIYTPYLVLDNTMVSLLQSVAQSGVRVRVMTPGIPDKRYVYTVTRSFYGPLAEAGVEIYEYTPGFLHAKMCLVDDEIAVVGSINFDYRSFYLQNEVAVWLWRSPAVAEVAADVAATLPDCRRITNEMINAVPWWRRLWRAVLRTFAPLM